MASASGLSNIEKLTENNYELWKVHMKSVLVYNDLWQYVDGTEVKPRENAHDWIKKDSKALALINLSISHSQLNYVKKAETSKGAWDCLKGIFESKGPVRKATLYKQLLRMKKKANVTITQHVNDFTSKAGQLEEAGIEIPDELLSIMLLNSLPEEYENFSVAIESRDDIPTLEVLKAKLKEEEARQSDRDAKTGDKSDALMARGGAHRGRHPWRNTSANLKDGSARMNTPKFDGKCFNCDKVGHRSRDCRIKPKQNKTSNADNALTSIACNAELTTESGVWCLDSGATRHMCNNRQKFGTLNKDDNTRVYTASEHFIESVGSGDINVNLRTNKRIENNQIKIQNALCVPKLRNNLLSVPSITDKGLSVTFQKNRAFVNRKDGSTMLTATKRNQLYVIDERLDRAMLAENEVSKNLLKWHQRYGHVNINDLKKMKEEEKVTGMNFTANQNQINCEICAKSKIHVQSFGSSTHREEDVLGLVHSDICGPISTESLGGAKYFVTFTDDRTRYTETTMLRNRSDVLEAFKTFKLKAEKQTGQRIKKLRTDNGREYLSNAFKDFLRSEGILHQLSVEYTPQQNGVAERKNRTLVEMARCIMLQGNLPQSLWAEAVNAATYIRNRCTTKSLNGETPFEAWSKRKPYVGFFRIIGSKAIVLNKAHGRGKFQPKGDEYVLVGYSEESKAYRLWKPGTKTVIKARDVRFFENQESTNTTTKDPIITLDNKEASTRSYIPLEEPESQHEERQDDEESDEDTDEEESTIASEERGDEVRHGRGRPKLMKTGKPGRPKKVYQTRSARTSDPKTVSEALNRDDHEA
jgi:hypothetical protein